MEKRGYPIGFTVKQINNIYEKDLNENLKQLGDHRITVRGTGFFASY